MGNQVPEKKTMSTLFAYGSLQLPQVMHAVTGRCFLGKPARLEHYVRRKLRGESFPGIRPLAGSTVHGLVFTDVDAYSLRRLDEFEGDYYRRRQLAIILYPDTEIKAETYVLSEKFYDLLLPEDWDLDAFRRNMMPLIVRAL